MSDFTGRREPDTKERMQGSLDLASFGARGVSAFYFILVLGIGDWGGEGIPRDVKSCFMPRYASPTPMSVMLEVGFISK